jgi:hypothetical protein
MQDREVEDRCVKFLLSASHDRFARLVVAVISDRDSGISIRMRLTSLEREHLSCDLSLLFDRSVCIFATSLQ